MGAIRDRTYFENLQKKLRSFLEKCQDLQYADSIGMNSFVIAACRKIGDADRNIPRDMFLSLRKDVLRVLLNCSHLDYFIHQASDTVVKLRLELLLERYISRTYFREGNIFSRGFDKRLVRARMLKHEIDAYHRSQAEEAESMLGTIMVDGKPDVLSNWAY